MKLLPILFGIFVVATAFAIVLSKTFIRVSEGEGLVVFRFGTPFRVYGAGLAWVIPFVDRVVRVPLDSINDWQKMSDEQLRESVVEQALKINPMQTL
jgi:regulator of protease activity HflC (stomatin/prohibitin superfamily)